ncbi:hypothetical protein [Arthrobacter sp. TMS2-4]
MLLVVLVDGWLPVFVDFGVVQLVLFELRDEVAVQPSVPGGTFR